MSRGWYRVVYSVSFLVLSFLCSCSSSKTVAKDKTVGNKGVESSKDSEPADSAKTGVAVINMEDFQGLGIETPDIRLMYGVPRPVLERKQIAPQETAKSNIVVSGSKPQAGDIISGVVRGENDPIQMANITERDSLYRIVAHAVSDVNGKFAFKLVNPGNRLSVTFVGYGEAITDITGTSFDVTLVELPDLPMVDLSSDVKQTTMYGPPAVNYNKYNTQPLEVSAPKYPLVVHDGNPLVVLDGKIVGVDQEKLEAFDFEKDIHSREKVAALLGVRKRKVVASRLLESTAATTIWGMRAINGCLDVVTKKQYIPELSRENPDGYYQPLK